MTKKCCEAPKVCERLKLPIECHNTHVQCKTRGWTRLLPGDESSDSRSSDDLLRKRQKREAAVSKFWKDPRAKACCLAAGRPSPFASTLEHNVSCRAIGQPQHCGCNRSGAPRSVPKLMPSNIIEEDELFAEPVDEPQQCQLK